MGLDEVAELAGAGRRAARTAWPTSARGGLEQAACLGGGGADGVHPGQRGSGVPAVQRLPGRRCLPGDFAQQLRRLASRRGLRLAVRLRRRGSGFPGRGAIGAVIGSARVRRGMPAGRAAVQGCVPAGLGAVCRGRGGLVRAGEADSGAGGGVGAGRAAVGLFRCRAGREAAVAGCGGRASLGIGGLCWTCSARGGGLPGGRGGSASVAGSGGPGGQAAGFEGGQFPAGGDPSSAGGGGDLGGGRAGCGGQRGLDGRCRAVGRGCGYRGGRLGRGRVRGAVRPVGLRGVLLPSGHYVTPFPGFPRPGCCGLFWGVLAAVLTTITPGGAAGKRSARLSRLRGRLKPIAARPGPVKQTPFLPFGFRSNRA